MVEVKTWSSGLSRSRASALTYSVGSPGPVSTRQRVWGNMLASWMSGRWARVMTALLA